jgi:mannose-6-phosphate isomerase
MKTKGLFKLKGVVQHYDWGGFDFIPALLGQAHFSSSPCAELWLGAHDGGPSVVESPDGPVPLPELIAAAPDQILGASVADRFENLLPYLFKVLDARKMLSIQAHPTIAQARAGFEAEEAAGISIKASTRNYKDRNHKPEVHVALTDFWMLHGFRPLEEIAESLRSVQELQPLMPDFSERLALAGNDAAARSSLLRELYARAMTIPQAEVDSLLNPLISRLEKNSPTNKDLPDFWAARAAREFPLSDGHRDRGIFSIYLLNLVRLQPGEATYQSAGTLHAYLEGVNVELMANSNNVLRGGLTPKNVDVAELMRVLRFDEGKVDIIHGRDAGNGETVFATPAAEFELSRLQCSKDKEYHSGTRIGPDILIVMEGEVRATADGDKLQINKGESFFASQDCSYEITSQSESAVVFKASVPSAR